MLNTTILRSACADNFSIIQNTILNDETLSWKAKGILCYLLSKPSNWIVRTADIVNRSTDGEAAVRAAVKELRDRHYARLVQIRGDGKINGWQLVVSDSPSLKPEQKQDSENQHLGFQDVENRHITNTEAVTNTETNKTLDFSFQETKKRKARISPLMPEIPLTLNTPQFLEAWANWLADRKERGKRVTSRAAKMQLEKLEVWGVKKAIEAINLAIEKNWAGLFEPKSPSLHPVNFPMPQQRARNAL